MRSLIITPSSTSSQLASTLKPQITASAWTSSMWPWPRPWPHAPTASLTSLVFCTRLQLASNPDRLTLFLLRPSLHKSAQLYYRRTGQNYSFVIVVWHLYYSIVVIIKVKKSKSVPWHEQQRTNTMDRRTNRLNCHWSFGNTGTTKIDGEPSGNWCHCLDPSTGALRESGRITHEKVLQLYM